MRVGDKAFVSELLKTIREDQANTTAAKQPRTGIGTVESYVSADNTYGVYLYGSTSGLGASDGFHTVSGIIPNVGDTVSYSIDGQNRHITGILTGATPPKATFNPNEGWVQFTDDEVPSANPPSGTFYIYYKDGIPYYMDDTGTEHIMQGAAWLDGSGVPGAGLGDDGDYYLDNDTGDTYFKSGGTWSNVGNIEGPQGTPGTDGNDGNDGSSFIWQGAWVLTTVYAADDTVENDGSTFMCRTGHTATSGDEPGVGGSWTTYWDYMAVKGDAGPTGSQGDPGVDGDDGAAGTDGALWLSGAGAPAGGLGKITDWYLNETNGDVYEKTGATTWTLQSNLEGDQGAPGADGADGSVWYEGTGVPGTGLGVIGDFYLNDANGDVYEKTGASTWTLQANVQGPTGSQGDPGDDGADGVDGATWWDGSGAPAGGLGEIGDYYLNNDNGDVYEKTGASTWGVISNLEGPQGGQGDPGGDGADGSVWYDGTGAPSGGLGVAGDYYLNDANGDVYLKNGSWAIVANVEGPTGPGGADGDDGAPGSDGATWYHGSGAPSDVSNGTFDTDLSSWTVNDADSTTWLADGGPLGSGDGTVRTIGDGAGTETLYQDYSATLGKMTFSGDWWQSAANSVHLFVDWLTSGDAHISYEFLEYEDSATTSTWESGSMVIGPPPATAAKVRVNLRIKNNSTDEIRHDNISLTLGVIGDFYLDDDDGQVYEKTGASTWTSTTKFPDPPSTPPTVPTGLTLTPVSYDTDVGLEAAWSSGATEVQQFTLQYDRAYTGTVTFSLSASGTGGTLAAGDYSVAVSGVANGGVTASPPTTWQTQTVAAGEKLYVNITALPVTVQGYNVYCGLEGTDAEPLYEVWTTTTGSNVEVPERGVGGATSDVANITTFDNPVTVYTVDKSHTIEGLLGGTNYAAKVSVTDKWNQTTAFTTAVLQITNSDSSAPAIPEALALSEGYKSVGARWEPNAEPDFDYYNVRYAPEDLITPDIPDDDEWSYLRSHSNWIIVSDLYAGVAGEPNTQTNYFFQLQAVDSSGNQSDWSNQTGDYQSQKPSLITTGDIAYNSIIAGHISAGGIEAEKITSGTLKVGGSANSPDYLLVYDGTGQEIGRWDSTGLTIADSGEPNKVIQIVDGVLSFSNDTGSTWGTAISAEGIYADSILSGSIPGGHNPVPNSSFEIAPFSLTNTKTWTSAGDWQGHLAANNVNWDDASDPADLSDYSY